MNRLSALLLTAALILGGCAKDTVLQSPVESQSETESVQEETVEKISETQNEAIDNREEIEGMYEYKGVFFPGKFYTITRYNGNDYEIFLIDGDFLYEGGGLNLYEISYNAVTTFLYDDLDKVDSIWIQNAIPKGENIGILYSFVFKDSDSARDIGLDMYLNDEHEWKINFIGYAD